MKWALLLITTLASVSSWADCGPGGISIWPYQDTINNTPIILIDSYGDAEATVSAVYSYASLFLISLKDTVTLYKYDFVVGNPGVSHTQILLCAEEPLLEGEKYTLQVYGLAPSFDPNKYDMYLQKSWFVVNSKIDTTPPVFVGQPIEIDRFIYGGCPRVSLVRICPNLNETSDYLVKMHLVDPLEKWDVYEYSATSNGSLTVGGSDCETNFPQWLSKSFKVSFEVIDAFGNWGVNKSGYISITTPTKDDEMKYSETRHFSCP